MKKILLFSLLISLAACENTVVPRESGSCFYATIDMKKRKAIDKVGECADSIIVSDTTYYIISSGVIFSY